MLSIDDNVNHVCVWLFKSRSLDINQIDGTPSMSRHLLYEQNF